MLHIRSAGPADFAALAKVFHDAVRLGARAVYSEAECAA